VDNDVTAQVISGVTVLECRLLSVYYSGDCRMIQVVSSIALPLSTVDIYPTPQTSASIDVLNTDSAAGGAEGGTNNPHILFFGFVSSLGAGLPLPLVHSDDHSDEGVIISCPSVPGGTSFPYNLGRMLAHEVG